MPTAEENVNAMWRAGEQRERERRARGAEEAQREWERVHSLHINPKICEFLKRKIEEEQKETKSYFELNGVLPIGLASADLINAQNKEIEVLQAMYRKLCHPYAYGSIQV